jgi:hypothetical protein
MGMPVPDYTESGAGSLLAGCGEAAGMVSVLAERAAWGRPSFDARSGDHTSRLARRVLGD